MKKSTSSLFVIPISFLSYYVAAKFGLYFAIPPGIASAVWPAAGIGLALYLLYGRQALIGIFFAASLASSQAISGQFISFETNDWIVPMILALGTLVQYCVIKSVVIRLFNLPIAIAHLNKILIFLLVIGPLGSLIASVTGAVTIAYFDQLPFDSARAVFLTWWVGDAIGALFFAPITLMLLSDNILAVGAYRWRIVLPSLLIFFLATLVFFNSRQQITETQQLNFNARAEQLSERINIAENTLRQNLYALAGHFNASDLVTREDFHHFVNDITHHNIQFRAFGWVPKVQRSELTGWIENTAKPLYPTFALNQIKPKPAHLQKNYILPIFYIEPYRSNEKAIGLDLTAHPIVNSVVDKAIESGEPAITSPLQLAQEKQKFTGVVVYYPVYADRAPLATSAQRFDALLGLVEIVFEVDVLIKQQYELINKTGFTYQLKFDGDWIDRTQEVSNSPNTLSHQITFDFFDKQGTLLVFSKPEYHNLLIDWQSWSILVIGSIGAVVSMVLIMFSSGFSSQLEYRVSLQTARLTKANQQLQQANKAKSLFLANMSHEYRTPLNAILGLTEIGIRETQDENAKSYLSQIQRASGVMLNLINNVLDLSKAQEGKLTLDLSMVNVDDLMNEISDIFAIQAQQKGVIYRKENYIDKTTLIEIDKLKISQILINIVGNALKFTSKGEVCLELSLEQDHHNLLSIKISDTGIGIKQEQIEKLFNAFTQADETTTRQYGGTGLGLSISKQLVEFMKGEINVFSTYGVGTEFNIKIPVKTKTVAPKQVEGKSYSHQNSKDDTEKDAFIVQALIVEDNKVNQLVAQKQIQHCGAVTYLAENGKEALEFMNSKIPDIVFLDLHMPVMDGFTTAKTMKSDPKLKDIPIVILTASVLAEDKQIAADLGIEHYLIKPFKYEEVLKVMHDIFAEHDT
jgi:signal transduction histidine kinase/CheY-like chemotaxis protein